MKEIHIHIHKCGKAIHEKLDRIIQLLLGISTENQTMSGELDALTAQVAENTSAEQSAGILLDNIHQLLIDAIAAQNNGDTAALPALVSQLAESKAGLAAAVARNTPA